MENNSTISDKDFNIMLNVLGNERSQRIYDFMKRNAKLCSIKRSIIFYEDLLQDLKCNKSKKYIENFRYMNWKVNKEFHGRKAYEMFINRIINNITDNVIKFEKALLKHQELFQQVVKDMYNNVINNTTQGIWLSYPKTTVEKYNDGTRKLKLSTGEEFIAKKIGHKYKLILKLK